MYNLDLPPPGPPRMQLSPVTGWVFSRADWGGMRSDVDLCGQFEYIHPGNLR